jgi:hypothetical protein
MITDIILINNKPPEDREWIRIEKSNNSIFPNFVVDIVTEYFSKSNNHGCAYRFGLNLEQAKILHEAVGKIIQESVE